MRITPFRSLIILYGHEVSSYRDFTAATRSIVPPCRGYRRGKIVASVSHRRDTVNSCREYSLEGISTRLPLPRPRRSWRVSENAAHRSFIVIIYLHSTMRDRIDEVLQVCRRRSCHRYISRPLILRVRKARRTFVSVKCANILVFVVIYYSTDRFT